MALLALSPPCSAASRAAVEMASGPVHGTYHRVAGEMAASLADRGVELSVSRSPGSTENLDLLASGDARFAFAQQDTVSEYLRDLEGPSDESPVRVVGRVFFDYLHIFLRTPVHVEEARDLRHLRIWPGDAASGTRTTAVHFLESVGVPLSSLGERALSRSVLSPDVEDRSHPDELGMDGLAQLFRQDRLDVAMLMTTPGNRSVCRAMESGRFRLYPLHHRTLRLLTRETETDIFRRQIAIGNIPVETYPNQQNAIPTIAVPVLLVAERGVEPALAKTVLEEARAAWDRLAGTVGPEGCRLPDDQPPFGSLRHSNLVFLEGFEGELRWWQEIPPVLGYSVLVLVPLLLVWWLRRSGAHQQVWSVLSEERVALRIIGALALSVLLVTFLTYLFEHRTNENFSTPWESFWSITVYLFSGLEDRTPYTTAGRMVAALGLLLGPLLFAFLTGWLARFFIQWERRMPQNLTDHTLIVNWNERAIRIARELHHPVVTDRCVIVVLTNDDTLDVRRLKSSGIGTDEAFEDFYVTVGDPGSERALRNANAHDARTIVILADESVARNGAEGGSTPDERSIRTLIMLRRIARKEGLDRMHVIVELADAANEAVVDEIARDFPGLLERVSGLEVRTCLLAQAALSKGVSEFYRDLLRVSGGTNEVYALEIPPSAVGLSFRELAVRVMSAELPDPIMPVGLQRRVDGRLRIFSNPRGDTEASILREGDKLVFIAYKPMDAKVLAAAAAAGI